MSDNKNKRFAPALLDICMSIADGSEVRASLLMTKISSAIAELAQMDATAFFSASVYDDGTEMRKEIRSSYFRLRAIEDEVREEGNRVWRTGYANLVKNNNRSAA